MSDLRTRIAKKLHALYASTDFIDSAWDDLHPMTQEKWLRDADAVIRELTVIIPPIVASAIHSYADSELAAMSYHGGSKDAFEAMEKLNTEAANIANYATTHQKWNGKADDE